MALSNNTTPQERRQRAALLSWRLDFLSCTTVIFLLCCWLSDVKHLEQSTSNDDNSTHQEATTILSESFLEHGFCLSPTLFHNTHFSCASFDLICAFVCILAIIFHVGSIHNNNNNSEKKKKKSLMLPGSAIYFFAHSYGHYIFSIKGDEQHQSTSDEDAAERIRSTIILAFILSIGPLEAASVLIKSNKLTPKHAYVMAALLLAILVGIYNEFISNTPSYALLYINISIILSISLPKLLFVGYVSPGDVAVRSTDAAVPKVVSGLCVLAVIICEPFFCDVFFSEIGGHFLFDLSLAFDVVIAVMMEQQKRSSVDEGEVEEKMKDS
jgi:hypothetical protein